MGEPVEHKTVLIPNPNPPYRIQSQECHAMILSNPATPAAATPQGRAQPVTTEINAEPVTLSEAADAVFGQGRMRESRDDIASRMGAVHG
jgi:hypothetical protein